MIEREVLAVPWISKSEFMETYHMVRSDKPSDWINAVSNLKAWKARFQRAAPVAIECTAMLLQSKMALVDSETQELDIDAVKLTCGMAIVRFMNLMAGRMMSLKNVRCRQTYSMFGEAARIGIADWLVGIRHALTHREVPSLTMMRPALNWAFQWLQREFWDAQRRDYKEHTISENLLTDECAAFVEEYHSANSQMDNAGLRLRVNSLKSALCHYLVQKDFPVPSEPLLNSLQISRTDVIDCIRRAELPEGLVTYWSRLIDALYHCHLTASLLRLLLRQLSCEQTERNFYISGWCYRLISLHASRSTGEDNIDFAWREVFDVCAYCPNIFTKKILTRIFPLMRPELPSHKQKQVLDLVDAFLEHSTQAALEDGALSSNPVLTVTAKMEMDESKDRVVTHSDPDYAAAKREGNSPSLWERCEDTGWETCPLGLLPGQNAQCLTLRDKRVMKWSKKRKAPTGDSVNVAAVSPRKQAKENSSDIGDISETSENVKNGGSEAKKTLEYEGEPIEDPIQPQVPDHSWNQAQIDAITGGLSLLH